MYLFHEEGREAAKRILGTTRLFSDSWGKDDKCRAHGYLTGIVYMTPTPIACAYATEECFETCLQFAGRMPTAKPARRVRSRLYDKSRGAFYSQLWHETKLLVRRAEKAGLRPAVRVNGTTDRQLLGDAGFRALVADWGEVQFYDYTKNPNHPALQGRAWPPRRYHVTYSFKGLPPRMDKGVPVYAEVVFARDLLSRGFNVAVVFEHDKPLPSTWQGYEVVDGDEHDLTFLAPPSTVIGLRAKGRARHLPTGGFKQASERRKTILEEIYGGPSGSYTGD